MMSADVNDRECAYNKERSQIYIRECAGAVNILMTCVWRADITMFLRDALANVLKIYMQYLDGFRTVLYTSINYS